MKTKTTYSSTKIQLSLIELCYLSVRTNEKPKNLGNANKEIKLLKNKLQKAQEENKTSIKHNPQIEIKLINCSTSVSNKRQLLSLQNRQIKITKGSEELYVIEQCIKKYHLYPFLENQDKKQKKVKNPLAAKKSHIQDCMRLLINSGILHSSKATVTVLQKEDQNTSPSKNSPQ